MCIIIFCLTTYRLTHRAEQSIEDDAGCRCERQTQEAPDSFGAGGAGRLQFNVHCMHHYLAVNDS